MSSAAPTATQLLTIPNAQVIGKKRARERDVLSSLPSKKPAKTHPLIRVGRHFTRTVQAFCDISELIKEGMDRNIALSHPDAVEEDIFGPEQNPDGTPNEDTEKTRREHRIFTRLLEMLSTLESSVCNSSTPEDLEHLIGLLARGAAGARSDDTKALKAAVIDWITPTNVPLTPPLARNNKSDRGFNHYWTGKLLCPAQLDWEDEQTRKSLMGGLTIPGDHWPTFVYLDYKFNPDDMWDGLFRSKILVSAYKHTFTSPSSVDQVTKATRSSNAHLNGMKQVTKASIAYIATQVRFALSSAATLSRHEVATDSETFYNSIIQFFELEEEEEELKELIRWWNGQVFPRHNPEEAAEVNDLASLPQIPSMVMLAKQQREEKRRRKGLAEVTNRNRNETPDPPADPQLTTSSAGGKEN